MPTPLANFGGNGNLLVTATATGAYNSGTEQKIDVALGRPALEALADIANAFHLRKGDLTGTTGRYALKLTASGSDLDLALSFLQQGVNEGDSIVLADV
jgi:hypothetical protein